jgi:hypothetical protein
MTTFRLTCADCGLLKDASEFANIHSRGAVVCKHCMALVEGKSAALTKPYEIELDAIRDICAAVERLPPDGQRRALEFVSTRYVAPQQMEMQA